MDDAMRREFEIVAGRLKVPREIVGSLGQAVDRFVGDADPYDYRQLRLSGSRIHNNEVPAIVEKIIRREIGKIPAEGMSQALFESLRRARLWPLEPSRGRTHDD